MGARQHLRIFRPRYRDPFHSIDVQHMSAHVMNIVLPAAWGLFSISLLA
jgi:hypothetical protein